VIRAFAALAVLLAACSGSPAPAPSSTSTTSAATTTTTATEIPEQLVGFDITEIVLASVEAAPRTLEVAVADDPAEQQQGLMNVADLGDLDGMLFVFAEDTASGFWMKDTLIPLDIAYFSADGRYVDSLTMEPCREDPCPLYHAAGAYRYAVEVAAGDFDTLRGDETLSFTE
jgi:uncharacterized protein